MGEGERKRKREGEREKERNGRATNWKLAVIQFRLRSFALMKLWRGEFDLF